MNATVAIAARELRERSRFVLAACAFAVLPFLVAMVPAARLHRANAIATVALILGTAYAFALALGLGASIIGRELTEKRLSFYFSKPLPAASIWAGKAIAALVLMVATYAIITLPSALAARETWEALERTAGTSAGWYLLLALVSVFLAAHAVSTMVRSRSLLIGIDFVAVIATGFAAYLLIVRPLLLGAAYGTIGAMRNLFGIGVLVILAAAPAWQLARGRTDARRGHAAFSQFLWSAIAALLLVTAVYVFWFTHPRAASLTAISTIEQMPSGDWLAVTGQTRGRDEYRSAFLVNAKSGAFERLPPPQGWGYGFSTDGRTYATLAHSELLRGDTLELHLWRFDGDRVRHVRTGIVERWPYGFVLSHDARRVAFVSDERVTVYDIESGRLLAAGPLRGDSPRALLFVRPDLVRIITGGLNRAPLRIRELDVARRTLTLTGERAQHEQYVIASGDASRLYLRTSNAIADGRTGAELVKLPVAPDRVVSGAMLRDGSVLITDKGGRLTWFDRNGVLRREIALPVAVGLIKEQIGDRRVVLYDSGDRRFRREASTVMLVNLESGKMERFARNRRPPGFLVDLEGRLRMHDENVQLTGWHEGKRQLVPLFER